MGTAVENQIKKEAETCFGAATKNDIVRTEAQFRDQGTLTEPRALVQGHLGMLPHSG